MKLIFLTVLVLALSSTLAVRPCVNEKNQEVDWYFAIRVPSKPSDRKYIIFDNKSNGFRGINGEEFLKFIFDSVNLNKDKIAAWSDQKPGTKKSSSSTKAHSKGIMIVDESNHGFILSHSIPRFPKISKTSIDYVTNPKSKYGQSMVCMTLKGEKKNIEKIYNALLSSYVDFYEDDFKLEFSGEREGTMPKMLGRPSRPIYMPTYVKLLNGFSIVTKSRDSRELPFEDTLSDHFKKGWLIESWGRPYLNSQCEIKNGERKAINIKLLKFGDHVWKSSQDHSKWAISTTGNWVCFGDLNHMNSQAKRGGSFFCENSSKLHKAFKDMILVTECDKNIEELMKKYVPEKKNGWAAWNEKKKREAGGKTKKKSGWSTRNKKKKRKTASKTKKKYRWSTRKRKKKRKTSSKTKKKNGWAAWREKKKREAAAKAKKTGSH